MSLWIHQKVEALDDGEYRDLYLAFDRAFDWSPADPRLRGPGRHDARLRCADRAGHRQGGRKGPFQAAEVADETLANLLESQAEMSPARDRLKELLDEERRGSA